MSFRIVLAIGGVALASLQAIPAYAQLFRAYLSSTGNDTNPCTLQQPCRLLPTALNAMQDGGEIWMLDSANYNNATVNITKSATILAVPGAVGSVVGTAGANAITIATAGIKVTLRNLVLAPLPGVSSPYGVEVTSNAVLTIEGGVIARFFNAGVTVSAAAAVARITGTIFRDNYLSGLRATGNNTRVSISDSKFFGQAGDTIVAHGSSTGPTRIAVSDSVIADCGSGIYAYTTIAGSTARIMVTRSVISACLYGAAAEGNAGTASVTLSGTTLFDINGNMILQSGNGVVETLGNNTGRHNGVNSGAVTQVGTF